MKSNDINFEEMNELVYYDENSPSCLRWKVDKGKVKTGNTAGYVSTDKRGYQRWIVQISGKSYKVHRIVYALQHKQITSDLQIDHIDGDSLNNKIANLRAVTNRTNSRNQKQRKTNTTGVTGVRFSASSGSTYYIAYYHNQDGNMQSKCFSCKKLGSDTAFELACAWRTKMIEQLNAILCSDGYTDRHGN